MNEKLHIKVLEAFLNDAEFRARAAITFIDMDEINKAREILSVMYADMQNRRISYEHNKSDAE